MFLLNIKNGKDEITKIFHETRAGPRWDSVFDLSLRLDAALRTDCELWRHTRWAFSINRRNRGWEKIEVGERRLRRDVILSSTIIRRVASRNSKFRRVSAEVRFARNFENWCVKKRWKRVPGLIVGKSFWHSAIATRAKVELYDILETITRLRSLLFNIPLF